MTFLSATIDLEHGHLDRFVHSNDSWRANPKAIRRAVAEAQDAWARHHLGRHDEAARWVDDLASRRYSLAGDLGLSVLGLYAVAADVLAEQGDAPRASELEGLVAPYARQMLVTSALFPAPIASADRALGQLAFAQGRHDDAVARVRSGLVSEEGFRAPFLAARSRYWLARVLAERDAPGDGEEAAALLEECRTEAASIGLVQLAGMVEALAARWT